MVRITFVYFRLKGRDLLGLSLGQRDGHLTDVPPVGHNALGHDEDVREQKQTS